MKKLPFWRYLLKSPAGYASHELVILLLALLGFAFSPILLSLFKLQYTLLNILLILIAPIIVAYIFINVLFPRTSNNTIYCRYRHTLHMSIRFFGRYWKIDYIKNRDAIEDLLIKEFIEGLQYLVSKIKPKKVKVETHGWIYWNVMLCSEVQKLYNVKIIGGGPEQNPKPKKIMASTILSLMSWRYIRKHYAEIKDLSMRERTPYTLELTPR